MQRGKILGLLNFILPIPQPILPLPLFLFFQRKEKKEGFWLMQNKQINVSKYPRKSEKGRTLHWEPVALSTLTLDLPEMAFFSPYYDLAFKITGLDTFLQII